MKPNKKFTLSVRDVEIIEHCLRDRCNTVSKYRLETNEKNSRLADQELAEIHDLLGRMHGEKIWYRPKNKIYVSG